MKRMWFISALALGACQSIDDPASQVQVVQQATPGYQAEGMPSYEALSSLAAGCEAHVASVYAGRTAVPMASKKNFSIALGNSSKACEKLQQALITLRQTNIYQSEYEQNIAYAQNLVGAVGNGDSFDVPTNFPEAGVDDTAIQGPDIVPHSTISRQPLDPMPIHGQ